MQRLHTPSKRMIGCASTNTGMLELSPIGAAIQSSTVSAFNQSRRLPDFPCGRPKNRYYGFGMKAKTELLLYHLLWTSGMLMRPTFRNLNQSFEGWAYRNGFLRRIHELERQGFLESSRKPNSVDRVYCLTVMGRLHALGRDPATQWSRPWDKRCSRDGAASSEQSARKITKRAIWLPAGQCLGFT